LVVENTSARLLCSDDKQQLAITITKSSDACRVTTGTKCIFVTSPCPALLNAALFFETASQVQINICCVIAKNITPGLESIYVCVTPPWMIQIHEKH
jgi:hypothetical protein